MKPHTAKVVYTKLLSERRFLEPESGGQPVSGSTRFFCLFDSASFFRNSSKGRCCLEFEHLLARLKNNFVPYHYIPQADADSLSLAGDSRKNRAEGFIGCQSQSVPECSVSHRVGAVQNLSQKPSLTTAKLRM